MMSKSIRLLLVAGLLILSGFMMFTMRDALQKEDPNLTVQADARLRTYVMTQDIELLRNDLIELHKATEKDRIGAAALKRSAFLAWAVVLGVSLGLAVVELSRRSKG